VTDGRTVRRSDGQTDGQTESIIANTALCIARAMLTRCKNGTTKTVAMTSAHRSPLAAALLTSAGCPPSARVTSLGRCMRYSSWSIVHSYLLDLQ